MGCNTFDQEVGKRLLKQIGRIEKEKGVEYSQDELKTKFDVKNRETVAQWINGTRKMKAEHLYSVCKTLNISSDYLLGLNGDYHKKPSAVDDLGLPEKAIAQLKDIKKWADNEQDPETYFRKRFELLCTLLSDKRFEDFLNYFANIDWAAEETRTERKKKEAGEGHGAASAKHGYKFEKYLCLEKFGKLLVSVCHTEDLED